jgi:hypothetical protein
MRQRSRLEFIVEALMASLALNGRVPDPFPVNWMIGALRNAHQDGHTLDEVASSLDVAATTACDLDRMSGADRRQMAPARLLDAIQTATAVFVRASTSVAHIDAARAPYVEVTADQARRMVMQIGPATLFWVTLDAGGAVRIG